MFLTPDDRGKIKKKVIYLDSTKVDCAPIKKSWGGLKPPPPRFRCLCTGEWVFNSLEAEAVCIVPLSFGFAGLV